MGEKRERRMALLKDAMVASEERYVRDLQAAVRKLFSSLGLVCVELVNFLSADVLLCVCVHACVRACVRECVRACVQACVCACVCLFVWLVGGGMIGCVHAHGLLHSVRRRRVESSSPAYTWTAAPQHVGYWLYVLLCIYSQEFQAWASSQL